MFLSGLNKISANRAQRGLYAKTHLLARQEGG